MIRSCIAATMIVAGLSGVASADLVSGWDFNTTGSLNLNSTAGAVAGVASYVGGTAPNGNGLAGGSPNDLGANNERWTISSFPAQGTGSGTAGAQFAVSTVGYSNITLTFDQRFSNTSSAYSQLQYTVDGTNFITTGLANGGVYIATAGDSWFSESFDLSGIAGVANNANFAVRMVEVYKTGTTGYVASKSSSTYAATGTYGFDLVYINGTVPAPASLALLGMSGLAMGRRRR